HPYRYCLPLLATLPLCQELQPCGKTSRGKASVLDFSSQEFFSHWNSGCAGAGELAHLSEGSPHGYAAANAAHSMHSGNKSKVCCLN
uniref:Uncharacterized protein n=1 Tax=Athene cunicularia TaxID=194338 RepID=A0A663MH13_ATHCN